MFSLVMPSSSSSPSSSPSSSSSSSPSSSSSAAPRHGAVRRGRPLRSLFRFLVFPALRSLLGLAGVFRGTPGGPAGPAGGRGAPRVKMSSRLKHVAGFTVLSVASLSVAYILSSNLAGHDDPSRDWSGLQECSANHARGVLHKYKYSAIRRVRNPFVTWGDVAETIWGFIPVAPPLGTVDRLPYFSQGTEGQYQALLRVLPDSTVPRELSRLACKRCVVVGNGFVLANSSLGVEIDKRDIVIRMNEAPVSGYERDVGSRTSMRICYPESAGLAEERRGRDAAAALMVFVPHKVQDLLWLRDVVEGAAEAAGAAEAPYLLWQLGIVENVSSTVPSGKRPGLMWLRTGTKDQKQRTHVFWKNVTTRLRYRPERIRILRPDIIRSVAFDLLKLTRKKSAKQCQVPTTGLMALGLALHFCDEVSIAGFGYNVSAPKQLVHYYSKDDTMGALLAEGGAHHILREKSVLQRLIAAGAITDLSSALRD